MADQRRSSMTSPFDEMLAETRRQMDELSGPGSGRGTSATRQNGAGGDRPVPSSRPPEAHPSRTAAASASRFPESREAPSDAIRFLNDRYGERWRYEVTERRRDGDEVIVLCRLIIDDLGVAKSQFGQARVAGTSPQGHATGHAIGHASGRAAGGVSFSIGPAPAIGDAAVDPEEAAYQSAIERALAKCAGML